MRAAAAQVTKNMVPGESVYGEKRISVESGTEGEKTEYRVWNPFRSKLAASVLAGVDNIHVKPGAKVPTLLSACHGILSQSSPPVCIKSHTGPAAAASESPAHEFATG